MPRKQQFRLSVLFRQDRGGNDLAAFLDMLRYDRATVESWNIDGQTSVVEVTLAKENFAFTIDRWKSFGLNVAQLETRYS